MTMPGVSFHSAGLSPEHLCRLRSAADKTFPFEVKDDGLRRLFRGEFSGVNGDIGVGWGFVRVRDSRELFENSGAGLGV